ncbi:MAG: GTPase Era [Solirubrobacterales bacterium]|nr:GTPase Era [Solirubrobacterales bacterium]
MGAEVTKCGFVALAGRPNAGKSTLTNLLVGEKVAIVSDRPQTTRRAIRGVVTTDERQLILTDLPGVQRPRDELTTRMQRRVERELGDTDVVLLVINGIEGVGAGDRFIASLLAKAKAPVIAAVNKVDKVSHSQMLEVLTATEALGVADSIVPISARKGSGIEQLLIELTAHLPEGPFLFPIDERSDQPLDVEFAELVREQILRRTREEVPHAVEVQVEEIQTRRDGLLTVRAVIFVEAESQKGIIVGRGGRMVKAVGTAARKEIQSLTGNRCHLELSVRVRKDWRGDERLLDRLGIN